VGAVGTVILGVLLFNEPMGALRVASVVLIIAGLVGLKRAA
jgi:quaternary ammonium compound-resistance protein SugE